MKDRKGQRVLIEEAGEFFLVRANQVEAMGDTVVGQSADGPNEAKLAVGERCVETAAAATNMWPLCHLLGDYERLVDLASKAATRAAELESSVLGNMAVMRLDVKEGFGIPNAVT